MDGGRGLTEDVLFLACTRPALWQGVPIEAACLNLMFTGTIFVIMKNPLYMLIGVALHYATRAFIALDYNCFSVARLWLDTKGRCRNARYWGGSSVSPLPIGRARRPWQVRVHV